MKRTLARVTWWVGVGFVLAGACGAPVAVATSLKEPLELTGQPLGVEQVVAVAKGLQPVSVQPAARARVAQGFEVVLAAARAGMPVYGLTTGVGWNKDRQALVKNGALDPDLLTASQRFNIGTLRAHAAAVGPWLPDDAVRAAMVLRLNLLLSGAAGVQPAVADQYAAFLNAGITPLVPARGSIGEADILQSSHIGLALAGEWQVHWRGEVLPAAAALQRAGLKPVQLVGKDFLSIIGDNSLMLGRAALVLHSARQWLDRETVVFALSLEGLNGNVAPFLEASVAARPRPGLVAAAAQLRDALAGSALWQADDARPLQDPLSFRTMPHVLGNAREALEAAEAEFAFESAHSGDNPQVVLGAVTLASGAATTASASQAARYLVPGTSGAIVPAASFEALPVVAVLERLSLALAHVASSVASTVYRFENPEITHLPRFLTAPGNPGHGFGAVQKSVAALTTEIRSLALPVSLDEATLAGNIEDKTNNAPLTVQRLQEMVDLLYPLASLQLLHAAQAVDLRTGFKQGSQTQALQHAYRARVPFVAQDRILSPDIEAGAQLLREGWSGSAASTFTAGGDHE
jgi:histidine ammonia-lyase